MLGGAPVNQSPRCVARLHPGACGERAQSAQSIHIPARAGERRRSACALLAGGVFGGVIDHDCDVFGNRGMLRIQAAGTAGGGSAGRSGGGVDLVQAGWAQAAGLTDGAIQPAHWRALLDVGAIGGVIVHDYDVGAAPY